MFRGILATTQLTLLLLAVSYGQDDSPVLTIAGLGEVKGTTTKSNSNSKTIYSFLSIPYGNTSKDELRFKEATPSLPWKGVIDGSKSGPVCPQPKIFTSPFTPNGEGVDFTTSMSEDCLRLDVHTTQLSKKAKLPVFVFLHGGGFAIGGSYSIKPNFLLDHDMVLVVPQYRLGPLGFLSLDTEDIPGNAGLFDQNLALKWVRDHIEDFGGDPDQVTLGGHSTGAASAVLHMMSPLSAGLFQRIIIHGGSGIAHWAVSEDPLPAARQFANTAGCYDETIKNLTSCLQKLSVDDMMKAYRGQDGNFLSPVVQKSVNTKFIYKNTFDQLTLKEYIPVPIMAGSNKHEGLLYLEYLYNSWLKPNNFTDNKEYLKNELVGHISGSYGVPDSSGVLVDALTKRFFDQDDLGDLYAMFDGLVDLCGSAFVKGHIYRLVQFNSDLKSSYLYTFNYYGKDHIVKHANTSPQKDGVIHGDEMVYLFPQENIQLNEEQKRISSIFTEIWTNFIIHGDPNPNGNKSESIPTWAAYTKENDTYLIIERNETTVGSNFRDQFTAARDDGLNTSGGKIIKSWATLILFSFSAHLFLPN